jgi:parvulin-like peptidyl-prolyl isomerase
MRATLVMALLAACAGALRAASDDLPVRWVNGEVITFADVMLRTSMRYATYQRMGKVVPGPDPAAKKERIAFCQESLEQLTDEKLMVQKAKTLHLVPDHDHVVLEVLEIAKENGREGLTLSDQAKEVKIREREESIDYLLDYYYDLRLPAVSPAELYQTYLARQGEFRLPARAHVFAIVLLPTDPALVDDLKRQRAELFKKAQIDEDPDVAKPATSRLDAIVASKTAAEEDTLLDAAMAEIAALDGNRALAPKSAALVKAVVALRASVAAEQTMEQCLAKLKAARAGLEGKDEAAFRPVASGLSQGPHAAEGGDNGWKSPGEFPAEVDQRVFALPPHGLSEAFSSRNAAWLVYVSERQAARERTFADVLGELEPQLHDARRADLRRTVSGVLRKSASITDVVALRDISD